MMPRLLALCLIAFLTVACAHAPAAPKVVSAPDTTRPFSDTDQEIAYHVFMGELASERGDAATAVGEYLAAARLSPDATLSSRAAILAYGAGDDAAALEAAQRWLSLAPKDRD